MPVIHNEVGIAQFSRGAEVQKLTVEPAVIDDGRVAQGTKRDADRHTANRIVDNLVPNQDAQRVGLRLTIDDQPNNRRCVHKFLFRGDLDEFVVVDRWNPVFRRTARKELIKRDDMLGEIRSRPFKFPIAWVCRCRPNQKQDQQEKAVEYLFHGFECGGGLWPRQVTLM